MRSFFVFGILCLTMCPMGTFSFSTTNFGLLTLSPKKAKSSKTSFLFSTKPNKAEQSVITYTPVFDFSKSEEKAVEKFERIDDAIMGGISLSSLKQSPGESFARWSGICRLDGGGFCGTRTLPFEEPLNVGDADGLYLLCRLTSDDEPERRVWKMTTRVEQSRGEQLYQAMYQLPPKYNGTENTTTTTTTNEWNRVLVPFSDFVEVRGPRVVNDGAPLNVTGGLFQIGLTLSKFKISSSSLELENFRPGYFELQIQEIGVFKNDTVDLVVESPKTLTKKEVQKKKPVALKMLAPLFKVFFNEKKRRRDSALRMLQKRGLSKPQAIMFGIRRREKAKGKLVAIFQTLNIILGDALRLTIYWALRLSIVYPLIAIRRLTKAIKGNRGSRVSK